MLAEAKKGKGAPSVAEEDEKKGGKGSKSAVDLAKIEKDAKSDAVRCDIDDASV